MSPPPDSGNFLKTGGALGSGLGASAFGTGEDSPLIGTLIGNVRIIDFIGAGGMGEVFLGVDERLDRKLAVKTLRPGIHVSRAAQDRFRREARILSRLDHPSICRLYDLKIVDDQPFLLLEYLEGISLAEFEEKMPERELLNIAVPVARALAAAHREGIIHRDLKPDNVMLMPDGRVKILDFGIGRFMEEPQPEESEAPPGASGEAPGGATPTMRGTIIGTPRFMSPEQARGEALTPATDLYSFGLLIYELLAGASPYRTTEPLALLLEIPETEIKSPSSASPAMTKLLSALLEKDPLLRPTAAEAAEMLEAIRQAPGRRRKKIAGISLAALALLAVVGALIGGRILGEGRYRCRGFESRLEGTWDGKTRAHLQSVYEEAGLRNTWTLVDKVLSGYTENWITAKTRACEATWTRKEQSTQSLELENSCLDRRLQSFQALVSVLSEDPQATANRAIQAAHALPGLESCFQLEVLRSKVPLPDDPKSRSTLDALRSPIARARALYDAGKYPEGMHILSGVEGKIREMDYPPLSAEFDYVEALLQERLGRLRTSDQTLRDAVLQAEAGRDDRRLAQAWVRRVWIQGNQLTDFEEAAESVQFARAAIRRLGGDPEIEGALANHRGVLEENRENYKEALRLMLEALRLRRRAFGKEHPKIASSLQNCANIYSELGEPEKALGMAKEALKMQRELLGPSHPSVYLSLSGVSSILIELGRKEEAQKLQDEAIALVENSYPPDHPIIGVLKSNLSVAALRAGQSERAHRLSSEALLILRKDPGPEALATANALLNLTMACEQLEDWNSVVEKAREALPIFEKLYGADSRDCLKLKASLGLGLVKRGGMEEARKILGSALKVMEKEPEPSTLRFILRFRYFLALESTQPEQALRQANLALEEIKALDDPELDSDAAQLRHWMAAHTP